jgi:hypothetical protein
VHFVLNSCALPSQRDTQSGVPFTMPSLRGGEPEGNESERVPGGYLRVAKASWSWELLQSTTTERGSWAIIKASGQVSHVAAREACDDSPTMPCNIWNETGEPEGSEALRDLLRGGGLERCLDQIN